ncbi:MAG: DsbA family protein [Patescibacteria group bacterium]|nr:MAG: DsbA family protein [Patescibacteria group bacterium]
MNDEHDIQGEIKELESRLSNLKRDAKSNEPKQNPYAIPVAIVVAGLLIAGAVFLQGGFSVSEKQTEGKALSQNGVPTSSTSATDNIKPVTDEDHIKGDPNAKVILVEFSDIECPFCKRFHPTMQQLMDEYGKTGQVAWVYRHFPLDQIHSKSRKEAQAVECANELGGNDAFWKYLDKIFEITPSNDRLDLSLLPQVAKDIGLDRIQFEACLSGDARGGKYADHIEDNYQDAIASGGTGTPYSVIIAPNGKKFPLTGAQPYGAVRSVIELALKEVK